MSGRKRHYSSEVNHTTMSMNLNRMSQWLLPIAILLLPTLACAQTFFSAENYSQDISLQYLSFIFSEVEGTAVTAGGVTTLKAVLTAFNMAVTTLGAIVILYSLLVSTINTANDGEALGKEWSSVWIPVRAALGFALLLPVKGTTSYSVIQVFVMWVVTQGIFAADFLWAESVDSVLSGGMMTPSMGEENTSGADLTAQKIFLALVCAKQASLDSGFRVSNTGPVNGRYVFGIAASSGSSVSGLAGVPIAKAIDDCGSIDLMTSGDYANETNTQIAEMITSLDDTANYFIQNYEKFSNNLPISVEAKIQEDISKAGGDYIQAMTLATARAGTTSELEDTDKDMSTLFDKTKSAGWSMAGASFLLLANTADMQASSTATIPSVNPIDADILNYVPDEDAFNTEITTASEISTADNMEITSSEDVTKALQEALRPVQEYFLQILTTNMQMFTGNEPGESMVNPLISTMTWGLFMVRLVVTAYAIFVGVMVVAGGAAAAVGGSLLGAIGGDVFSGMFTTALNFITAPVLILFGVLFATGITWAYYVPLIPFIIFTTGIFGWLILVVEAMVAAPLMAIGVLHPEGRHTVFGSAQSGIMILCGVFLRPSLMIVGMIASLVFCYITVFVISIGFVPVATSIAVKNYSLVGLAVMTVFYTAFIVIGLNRAFTLIHILPDRVMRWLGQPAEQGGADKELQEMKQTSQETGKGFSDSGSSGGQGAKEQVDQGIQQANKKQRDHATLNKQDTTGGSGSISAE